jgi:hypothetical protein
MREAGTVHALLLHVQLTTAAINAQLTVAAIMDQVFVVGE